jgi:hypothetical protein
VIHNCVTYSPEDLAVAVNGETIAAKFWHDTGPWLGVERHEILRRALPLCCSPMQAEHLGIPAVLVPPPVDVDRFVRAGLAMPRGDRLGAVCIASWRNSGKGPRRAQEWAASEGVELAFYGEGVHAPAGSQQVPYANMPELLARYRTFVFLPTSLEPFGRLVAEAWAAGCELVTNRMVGALYWIEEAPERIETAAADFWTAVVG